MPETQQQPTSHDTIEGAGPKPRDDEIDVYGLTHPGKLRKTNNDQFLIGSIHKRLDIRQTSLSELESQPFGDERLAFLLMVADGVGAGERGQEASKLALQTVTEYVSSSMRAYYAANGNAEHFAEALQEAAMVCHAELLERATQRPEYRGMATTLTLLLGVWPWFYLLQVGDSRHYVLHDGVLTQLTRDQTMAEDLIAQGAFQRTEAFMAKWSHVLASSIGGQNAAPVVRRLRNSWNNVHLQCSDGLTKHVSDEQIKRRLTEMTSARQVCEQLLQDALEGGGTDNITIIVGRAVRKDP